jgi:hypothetical protein
MPDLFVAALANAASLARVAGTTHTRQSMPSLYRAAPAKPRHRNQLDLFGDTSISPALTGDSSLLPPARVPTNNRSIDTYAA